MPPVFASTSLHQHANASGNCFISNERSIEYFRHYIFPVPLLASIFGTLFVLVILVTQRRRTRMLATTNMAICALLVAHVLFMGTTVVHKIQSLGDDISEVKNDLKTMAFWEILRVPPGYIQCVVTVERLIAVVRPLQLRQIATRGRMIAALAFVITLPLVTQTAFTACLLTQRCSIRAYSINLLLLCCGIPFSCMSVCTSLIIAALIKKRRRTAPGRETQVDANSFRLAVILATIDLIYLFTTLPYTLSWILLPVLKRSESCRSVMMSSLLLTHFGSMTDWTVLLVLGKHIRKAGVKMLRCKTSSSSGNSGPKTSVRMKAICASQAEG